jgi:hypothetical protein
LKCQVRTLGEESASLVSSASLVCAFEVRTLGEESASLVSCAFGVKCAFRHATHCIHPSIGIHHSLSSIRHITPTSLLILRLSLFTLHPSLFTLHSSLFTLLPSTLHSPLSTLHHSPNKYRVTCITFSYGHTHQKAPDPVRSPKLSWCWRSQYYGGGPHGNTACCSFCLFLFFFCRFRLWRCAVYILYALYPCVYACVYACVEAVLPFGTLCCVSVCCCMAPLAIYPLHSYFLSDFYPHLYAASCPPSTVHRPPSTVHRPPSTVHRSPSTCTPTTPTTHRTPHTKGQPSVVFISSHAGFRKRGCKNRLDIALKHRDLTAQSRRKFQSHAAPPWKVFFAIYVEGADRKEMKERAKSNLLVLDRFSTLSMLFQTLCTIAESVCLFWACLLLTKTVEMFGGS